MDWIIRAASLEDAPAIVDMIWTAVDEGYFHYTLSLEAFKKYAFEDHSQEIVLLVCYDTEQIRGYIDARLHHEIGEILGLYIKSAYRRQGIGTTLVKRVISILTDWNCREVRVKVLANNHGAIEFYTQLNFTVEGASHEDSELILLSRRL